MLLPVYSSTISQYKTAQSTTILAHYAHLKKWWKLKQPNMNKQAAISTRQVDNLGTRYVKPGAHHQSDGRCSVVTLQSWAGVGSVGIHEHYFPWANSRQTTLQTIIVIRLEIPGAPFNASTNRFILITSNHTCCHRLESKTFFVYTTRTLRSTWIKPNSFFFYLHPITKQPVVSHTQTFNKSTYLQKTASKIRSIS